MDRFEHYGWPFFEERHRALAMDAEDRSVANHVEEKDADATCRNFVKALGKSPDRLSPIDLTAMEVVASTPVGENGAA